MREPFSRRQAINSALPTALRRYVAPLRRATSRAAAPPREAVAGAAALAGAGVARIAPFDADPRSADALGSRLEAHNPKLEVQIGVKDPSGYDIVVNATPIGMNDGDPLPIDVERIAPSTFVGEVVMNQEMTPFLRSAQAKGCAIQVGVDMLFEQIPAYLELFGFPTTTPDEL